VNTGEGEMLAGDDDVLVVQKKGVSHIAAKPRTIRKINYNFRVVQLNSASRATPSLVFQVPGFLPKTRTGKTHEEREKVKNHKCRAC
jgi:hypothetical protein